MAATIPTPADSDWVTPKEAVELFRGTPYPVSVSTIKRWVREYRLDTRMIGSAKAASYSDLLEIHRDRIVDRDAAAG
ncbi:hypothetical protein IQ62_01260 [Streptomyces scabiei]|uniref:hypothetical protein n=1 Tax=Streptomyces scabiei TaxID=1930 RepID=UPI0004E6D3C1|nr:hypothetical protein [Streptomyces scabiei]KFG02564.1 hypothetical protein IQ62_01260 [Streptomyces scabiei]